MVFMVLTSFAHAKMDSSVLWEFAWYGCIIIAGAVVSLIIMSKNHGVGKSFGVLTYIYIAFGTFVFLLAMILLNRFSEYINEILSLVVFLAIGFSYDYCAKFVVEREEGQED